MPYIHIYTPWIDIKNKEKVFCQHSLILKCRRIGPLSPDNFKKSVVGRLSQFSYLWRWNRSRCILEGFPQLCLWRKLTYIGVCLLFHDGPIIFYGVQIGRTCRPVNLRIALNNPDKPRLSDSSVKRHALGTFLSIGPPFPCISVTM